MVTSSKKKPAQKKTTTRASKKEAVPSQDIPTTSSSGTSGFAIAALVLGICGLLFLFIGFVFAIPALVFGILALVQHKPGRGMAIVGIVCGAIALLLSILLLTVIMILGFSWFSVMLDPASFMPNHAFFEDDFSSVAVQLTETGVVVFEVNSIGKETPQVLAVTNGGGDCLGASLIDSTISGEHIVFRVQCPAPEEDIIVGEFELTYTFDGKSEMTDVVFSGSLPSPMVE
jgi:hypothetical protein